VDDGGTSPGLGRGVRGVLQFVRVVAVLTVLFGVGAAGSSFEDDFDVRGRNRGVFGGGVLALLGIEDPPDGDMGPVWIGRACVVVGAALTVGITMLLDRDRKRRTPSP